MRYAMRRIQLLGAMLACCGVLVGCGATHVNRGPASASLRTVVSSRQVTSTDSPTSLAASARGGSAPSQRQTPPARASRGGVANTASLPVLSEAWLPNAQRGMPQRILRRIAAQDRAALAQIKASARAPVSTQAGCYQVRRRLTTAPGSPRWLGIPFAPAIDAHLIGHHVEVAFSFARWSKSLACRPAVLTLVVSGQHPELISPSTPARQRGASATITTFRLIGPRGRVISRLPLDQPPPYSVRVTASVINNIRSAAVTADLTCPYSTSTTVGCAAPAHADATGAPDLIPPSGPLNPLRLFAPLELQQSMASVTAHQPITPNVQCPSTTHCQLTYHSSDAPSQPYTIDYKIAAEQVRGCWMALRETSYTDPPPYVYSGVDELAGCARWPT
jgi:hypothetical protein